MRENKLTPDDLKYISNFIYKNAGIVIGQDKAYLVETRLLDVARILGQSSLARLVHQLKTTRDRQLETLVVDALTTNETMWFRDRRPFAALQNHVLPQIHAQKQTRILRIWSAACSSGQEPFSLAMMIKELGIFEDWQIFIYGTDISSQMIEKAQKGIYSQFEINRGLPAKFLVKYFHQIDDDNWQINSSLQKMVIFKKHNILSDPPPYTNFDLILCRNVLIYFDVPAKKRILSNIFHSLSPDGYLMLGASESTFGISEHFQSNKIDDAVFYRPLKINHLSALNSVGV